jgi:hypothetical protein
MEKEWWKYGNLTRAQIAMFRIPTFMTTISAKKDEDLPNVQIDKGA